MYIAYGHCRITLRQLSDLLEKDSPEIMAELLADPDEFQKYLQEISGDIGMTIKLLMVLERGFQSSQSAELIRKALEILVQENFLFGFTEKLYSLSHHRLSHHRLNVAIETVLNIWISVSRTTTFSLEELGLSNCLRFVNMCLPNLDPEYYTTIITKSTRLRESLEKEKEIDFNNFTRINIIPSKSDIEIDPCSYLKVNKNTYTDRFEYLETHFHLMREDVVMPLRKAIRHFKENNGKKPKHKIDDVFIYYDVKFLCSYLGKDGFCSQLSISKTKKKPFSERLKPGSLVVISGDMFDTYFFAVVTTKVQKKSDQIDVKFDRTDWHQLDSLKDIPLTMIETSAYFLPYQHVLEVLQKFADTEVTLPFSEYIISGLQVDIPPPTYIQEDTVLKVQLSECEEKIYPFSFDTKSLLNIKPMDQEWPTADELHFDDSQMKAFRNALTREFVLIQGPPGCGKTHVGLRIVETLLQNRKLTGLPILIVCFTNHALDQFLEGILNSVNTCEIVRVGSRSNSVVLDPYTLFNKRKDVKCKRIKTKITKAIEYKKRLELKINTVAFKIKLARENLLNLNAFSDILPWTVQQEFLWRQNDDDDRGSSVIMQWLFKEETHKITEYTQCRCEFSEDDKKQFGNVNTEEIRAFRQQKIAFCARCGPQFLRRSVTQLLNNVNHTKTTEEDLDLSDNVFYESKNCRQQIYCKWLRRFCDVFENQIFKHRLEIDDACKRVKETNKVLDKKVLCKSDIIGITSTGCALNWDLLCEVKPNVVIAEEAAEVCESHLLASLTPSTKHLILIGDHRQLRPKTTVHELRRNYKIDISMFERMICNKIQYTCLRKQHRMRPLIADNVRTIYKDLIDSENVYDYENIKGMKYNMFWKDHRENETKVGTSFSNRYEVSFCIELCKYLGRQGYKPEQITILAMYKAQMKEIRQEVKRMSELSGVRVEDVDNYQGEENEIVILSTVRGNKCGELGHISNRNRICVAMSRAKKGLYIVGNSTTILKSKHSLWNKIYLNFLQVNQISESLVLKCQNHPDEETAVKQATDFEKCPNGGCTKQCQKVLSCSHKCNRLCHLDDPKHTNLMCKEKCLKKCENNHNCKKLCMEECGECTEIVERTHPDCHHTVKMKCYESVKNKSEYKCTFEVFEILPCGHECKRQCFETAQCNVMLEIERNCKHVEQVPCHQRSYPCSIDVPYLKNCGHTGIRKCSENGSHTTCSERIKYVRKSCGHVDTKLCSEVEETTPCYNICGLKLGCGHSCQSNCCAKEQHFFGSCLKGHSNECQVKCSVILGCGHECSGTCSSCQNGRYHVGCNSLCGCYLICGHKCRGKCGDCQPCSKQCNKRCKHAKLCDKQCFLPCRTCDSGCEWKCKHVNCTKRCGELCDRERCDIACDKKLLCGHVCIGMCGDPCPRACFTCHKSYFDTLRCDFKCHRFVQLHDCGHIIRTDIMDKYMDIEEKTAIWKTCPVCERVIQTSNGNRYECIINKFWRSANDIKSQLNDKETLMDKTRLEIERYIKNVVGNDFVSQSLKHLKSLSYQTLKDVERELQRELDCEMLIKSLADCSDEMLQESEIFMTIASDIIDAPHRYDEIIRNRLKYYLDNCSNSLCPSADLINVHFKYQEENHRKSIDSEDQIYTSCRKDESGAYSIEFFLPTKRSCCEYQ